MNTDVETVRGALIPHYTEAKQAALEAGALAFSIAGSGPSVFAITTEDRGNAREIGERIRSAFEGHCKLYSVTPSNTGATILHSETYF